MPSICFYFQVHQPKRLKKYTVFDINQDHFYENKIANESIMQKVASKCYLPANQVMYDLIKKHNGNFKISYSISGVAIEQMKLYSPETLDSFKRLVDTGCVELLGETYYHSLAILFSQDEFKRQVEKHRNLIRSEFGYEPKVFRNTELIYNTHVACNAELLGFKAILAEGVPQILDWRSPNHLYQPAYTQDMKLLLRNYPLSDDIAFRFSNRAWESYPLTAEKFSSWVHALDGDAEVINLFMDYETLGEHQWVDTGIFEFMKVLPEQIMQHSQFNFKTPSETIATYPARDQLDVGNYVSWADTERDLTAWKGNHLQEDALRAAYALEEKVYATANEELIATWQSLLTSDHFYYMCTKYFADGDVHKYFNPYESPYEAYTNFQNVLCDFAECLQQYSCPKLQAA